MIGIHATRSCHAFLEVTASALTSTYKYALQIKFNQEVHVVRLHNTTCRNPPPNSWTTNDLASSWKTLEMYWLIVTISFLILSSTGKTKTDQWQIVQNKTNNLNQNSLQCVYDDKSNHMFTNIFIYKTLLI